MAARAAWEMEALDIFDCPQIPKLLHVISPDDMSAFEDIHFVIERLPFNLRDLMRDKRHFLSEEITKLLGLDLLLAIEEVHSKGFLYNGMKEKHCIVEVQEGKQLLKLVDFGSLVPLCGLENTTALLPASSGGR